MEVVLAELQALPARDETSEDTLASPVVVLLPQQIPAMDDIRDLLRRNPGNLVRGVGGKPRGLGLNKVPCSASVSEAINAGGGSGGVVRSGVEVAMAEPQALPAQDETSEDTLSMPLRPLSGEEMRTLLRAHPESLIRGTGERLVRPPDRRITCSASLSDAIIEDRG